MASHAVDDPRRGLRVAVLGPVLVEGRDGGWVEPAGPLGKSLIATLALAGGTASSVQTLVDDVWDHNPPRQERAALQTLVSRVRANIADGLLESTASGYALGVTAAQTDLGRASELRGSARDAFQAGEHLRVEQVTSEALALWRGDPGSDIGSSAVASPLCDRAGDLKRELMKIRAASRSSLGDTDAALSDLEPLIAAHPLDEELQVLLLQTLEAGGRRTDAVRRFGRFRELLRDELGTDPGAELTGIHTRLLRADSAGAAGQSKVRTHRTAGLRAPQTRLIGREDDVHAVETLIAREPLTTILGAGGLGKTRLAQEIGNRATGVGFVVFVELASVRSADDITLAFASTLGIREARSVRVQADPGAGLDLRSRILLALSEQETLLIVDNCEHIVDAAAAWIADLLDSTSSVRVLATSRAPLSIAAEQVYPLDSLASGGTGNGTSSGGGTSTSTGTSSGGGTSTSTSTGNGNTAADDPAAHTGPLTPATSAGAALPDDAPAGPAVTLFVERARAARPGAILPLEAVARLCDRLDGLPLAIELAAARVRSMSVDEIERRLSNRFALLTSGERTAPERHRTLLAVIDWSWNLLTGAQQRLLRRLARYPDGFSAEAAEAVAGPEPGDVTDDLDALVTQSLVAVHEDPRTGILRYRMLETVREFGDIELERAGEGDLVRTGMFAWALRFSADELSGFEGSRQVQTFQHVNSEQDNLVAVLRDALDLGDARVALAAFSVLSYYWTLSSSHTEVLAFGTPVIEVSRSFVPRGPIEVPAAAACFVLIGATFLFTDFRTSAQAISRVRRIRRTESLASGRLEAMADLVSTAGNTEAGMRLLVKLQASTDPGRSSLAHLLGGQIDENQGQMDAAILHATRAYELSIEFSDTWSAAASAQSLAQLHSQLAHPYEALQWTERSRRGLEALHADGDLRQLDWLLAINSITIGDIDRARPMLETFAYDDEYGHERDFDFSDLRSIGLSGLGEIALAQGQREEGLRLQRAASDSFGPGIVPAPWRNVVSGSAIVSHVRADVDDHQLVHRYARSLRLSLLVSLKMMPLYVDKPVLGTGIFGLAAWMLWPSRQPSPGQVRAGHELLAIAGRLSSRQDMPTLNRARLEREVRDHYGDEQLDAFLAATRDLSPDDAAKRAIALLYEQKIARS